MFFINDLIDEWLEINLTVFRSRFEHVLIFGNFGTKWRIKFNPKKSKIIDFGRPLFKNHFYLNNLKKIN